MRKHGHLGEIVPPEAEIPDLKRKEKERKKAGAAWWGHGLPRPPFQGATGASGAGAAASAAGQAGSMAPSLAGGLLTRLTSTLAGKLMLALGGALALTGGLLSFRALWGPSSQGPAGLPLGPLSSSIKIPKGEPLHWVGPTKGDLKLETPSERSGPASQDKPPEAPRGEETARQEPDPGGASRETSADRLPHNLSGAKLTAQLGSQFGGKNIFERPEAPKYGQMGRGPTTPLSSLRRGPLSPMRRQARVGRVQRAGQVRGLSRRAMGQLKLARTLSGAAAQGSGEERQKTLAADAFEQRVTEGGSPGPGETPNPNTAGGGVVVPPGPGAPSDFGRVPTAQGINTTPYQIPLDRAKDMAKQAAKMKRTGSILMAIGAVLILAGIALMFVPVWGPIVGAILIALGATLVGIGITMNLMAQKMAKQARTLADQIQKAYSQTNQAQIVRECVDQAIATGSEDCRPATQAPDFSSSTSEAVEKERSSSYELERGQPVRP